MATTPPPPAVTQAELDAALKSEIEWVEKMDSIVKVLGEDLGEEEGEADVVEWDGHEDSLDLIRVMEAKRVELFGERE